MSDTADATLAKLTVCERFVTKELIQSKTPPCRNSESKLQTVKQDGMINCRPSKRHVVNVSGLVVRVSDS